MGTRQLEASKDCIIAAVPTVNKTRSQNQLNAPRGWVCAPLSTGLPLQCRHFAPTPRTQTPLPDPQVDVGMLSSLLSGLLAGYIGKYVRNLDREHLQVPPSHPFVPLTETPTLDLVDRLCPVVSRSL